MIILSPVSLRPSALNPQTVLHSRHSLGASSPELLSSLHTPRVEFLPCRHAPDQALEVFDRAFFRCVKNEPFFEGQYAKCHRFDSTPLQQVYRFDNAFGT